MGEFAGNQLDLKPSYDAKSLCEELAMRMAIYGDVKI